LTEPFRMHLFRTILILLFLFSSFCGNSQEWETPQPVICHADELDAFYSIAARHDMQKARAIAYSKIEVTYENFPATAQQAFEKAKEIWEGILISKISIKINAKWEALSGLTLAHSGASRIYRNTKNAKYRDTWYVGPLAEALAGEDLNNGEFDINMTFNSGTNWSFATDGSVFPGRYDLVTVALHEIAHGIGISSSFKLINNETEGQWGQSGFPYIYDIFIQNREEQLLTKSSNFSNSSTRLKEQIESGSLFFKIDFHPFSADLPKVYSPKPFKSGGSISHLDPGKYYTNSEHSLMLPSIPSASAIHKPGELLLSMLSQIGWAVNELAAFPILSQSQEFPVVAYPNPLISDEINLSFPDGKRSEKCNIRVTDESGKIIRTFEINTVENPLIKINLSDVTAGTYLIQVDSKYDQITKKVVKL
jgi:hypothetical protein